MYFQQKEHNSPHFHLYMGICRSY
ncbi:hypothetical protein [uncultured Brachyspira sp.]|nr:hypothetical protein [uncultured Brachyspira sp.]